MLTGRFVLRSCQPPPRLVRSISAPADIRCWGTTYRLAVLMEPVPSSLLSRGQFSDYRRFSTTVGSTTCRSEAEPRQSTRFKNYESNRSSFKWLAGIRGGNPDVRRLSNTNSAQRPCTLRFRTLVSLQQEDDRWESCAQIYQVALQIRH
jgi:hypothetical protein